MSLQAAALLLTAIIADTVTLFMVIAIPYAVAGY